jgi:hypothetical protein
MRRHAVRTGRVVAFRGEWGEAAGDAKSRRAYTVIECSSA